MSDERDFEQLQALRDHRASFTSPAMVTVEEWEDRIILTSGGYELVIMKDPTDPRRIRFSGVNVQTVKDLNAAFALLQEARRVMGQGGV